MYPYKLDRLPEVKACKILHCNLHYGQALNECAVGGI